MFVALELITKQTGSNHDLKLVAKVAKQDNLVSMTIQFTEFLKCFHMF